MATVVKSPFQCGGTAKRLPVGSTKKTIIRIDDAADTAKVWIRVARTEDVTSATAEFFLNAGEAIELCDIPPSDISILDASDDPLIYFKNF